MQDQRFALCFVIGASEEILPDMKQISVESQSWCVNFSVCGYLISSLQFSSLCAAFILLGFFLVCAVGWQVGSKLSSTNKWIMCKIANFCYSSCPVHELGL